MRLRVTAAVALALAFAGCALALDNGLALTPQMGWNSWNHFGCSINEQLIHDTADTMAALNLPAFGYKYLNLDDCWAGSRDANGKVQPDPAAFPSGMKALGDYIHSKGLLYGVYSDCGDVTCQGRPGSYGYNTQDAQSYASWTVDYLKFDNCNDTSEPTLLYPIMRDALNATGRSILFSMCEWGVQDPATWAPVVGNSWRTTGDIRDGWDSVLSNLDQNNRWADFAAPGGWNDPDMLEIGNGGLSQDEEVAHFSLWCLVKSPLLIGCDLTHISPASLATLTNTEAIAVSQDALGVQGKRVASTWNIVNSTAVFDFPGTYAAVAPCDQSRSDQKWWLHSASGVISSFGGQCLQLSGCTDNSGDNIVSVGACDATCGSGSSALQWKLTAAVDGLSFIQNQNNGQCLNAWQNNNPEVGTYPCDSAQLWQFNATDDTLRSLSFKAEGQCLSTTTVVPAGAAEVWAGPLANGDVAVVLFNRASSAVTMTADFERVGIFSPSASARDINAHTNLGTFTGAYTATVQPHAVQFVRFTPK